jgi:hypothetical protein
MKAPIIQVKRHKIKALLFGPKTWKLIKFTQREDSLSVFAFEVSQASSAGPCDVTSVQLKTTMEHLR